MKWKNNLRTIFCKKRKETKIRIPNQERNPNKENEKGIWIRNLNEKPKGTETLKCIGLHKLPIRLSQIPTYDVIFATFTLQPNAYVLVLTKVQIHTHLDYTITCTIRNGKDSGQ